VRAPHPPVVFTDEQWEPIADLLRALGINRPAKLLVRSVLSGNPWPLRDELEGLAAIIPELEKTLLPRHRYERLLAEALTHLNKVRGILKEIDPTGWTSGRLAPVIARLTTERDIILAQQAMPGANAGRPSRGRKTTQTVFRTQVIRLWTDDIVPAIARAHKAAPTRKQLAEFLEGVECPLFPEAKADAIERWLDRSPQPKPTWKRRNRKPRVGK
jgi:hypothetical protein